MKSTNTFSSSPNIVGSTPFTSPNSASSHAFVRRTVTKGGTPFAGTTGGVGAWSFARRVVAKNNNAWTGENLSSDGFGYDEAGGMAFGEAEFGGIKHFEKLKNP